MLKTYPMPGSNAERILNYIQANPGASTNKGITGLEMNPSVVRKCLTNLMTKGLLEDRPSQDGIHHYSAKAPTL